MATFSQLPSGKWRVQVRRSGIYRAATFTRKADARAWAAEIEGQAEHIAAGGFAPEALGQEEELRAGLHVREVGLGQAEHGLQFCTEGAVFFGFFGTGGFKPGHGCLQTD